MKKLYSLFLLFGLLFTACDSYFNEEPYQQIPQEEAYKTVSDITNNLNGIYYAFGFYKFMGRNVVAIGDLASDNANASATAGHFVTINTYTFSDTEATLADIWDYGYQVIDQTTRNINGANALLAEGGLSEENVATLNSAIAQCYGLRAFTAFTLVNLFGLPYGTDDYEHGGVIIVEKDPIEAKTVVSRASVKATYEWILRDIEQANRYPNQVDNDVQYYFNPAAVKALEARVNLYMGKYDVAAETARKAVELRGAAPIDDNAYVSMWTTTAISVEDIFTIVKSADDNLSANSLNTLYSTYGAALTKNILGVFSSGDIRFNLIDTLKGATHPKKFDGIAGNADVNNIPVFRVSEMFLIEAEAKVLTGDLDGARTALLYTARRNPAITSESDLPAAKEDLLAFISEERRREFFEEGHRWFDARRMGQSIAVVDGKYPDFNVKAFVYPIPSKEITAGFGTEQNPDWVDRLPGE